MHLSQKPPSKRFPYGYYRVETLASLFIAVLILLKGGEILRESIMRVMHLQPIFTPFHALVVAASSIPVLYIPSHYTLMTGRKINSQSLLSLAANYKAYMYSTTLVLIGLVVSLMGYPFF